MKQILMLCFLVSLKKTLKSNILMLKAQIQMQYSCLTMNAVTDATTPRDHLLLKIAPLLISRCCIDDCLLNLCATYVVTARTHFSNMYGTQQ